MNSQARVFRTNVNEIALSLCLKYVDDTQQLVCLATASKVCQQVVQTFVQQWAQQLVTNVTSSLRGLDDNSLLHQRKLMWLLQTAPTAAGSVSTSVVNIPAIPPTIMNTLLCCGIRPTYQQLIAAAKRRVLGVEGWIQSSLPANTLEIVCWQGAQDVFHPNRIQPGEMGDVLQFTVNMRTPGRAVQVITWALQDQPLSTAAWLQARHHLSDSNLVLWLLCTAVRRGHTQVVEVLSTQQAAYQFSQSDVQDLLLAACRSRNAAMVVALCDHKITQCLDVSNAALILEHAVHMGTPILSCLLNIPAVQSISATSINQLLQATLTSPRTSVAAATQALCSLPGMQQLDTEMLAGHISRCMEQIGDWAAGDSLLDCIRPLLQLPAMQQMSSSTLLLMLTTAFEHDALCIIAYLLQQPYAHQLGPQHLLTLLRSSVQCQWRRMLIGVLDAWPELLDCVGQLCRLPSAGAVAPTETAAVVREMMNGTSLFENLAGSILQLLPMDLANITQLVEAAVATNQYMVAYLVQAPAASHLSVDVISAALHVAFKRTEVQYFACDRQAVSKAIAALCSYPAAQHLSCVQLAELAVLALRKHYCSRTEQHQRVLDEALQRLLELPAAGQLNGEVVGGLLTAAVEAAAPVAVCQVAALPGCKHMEPQGLTDAMTKAMRLALPNDAVGCLIMLVITRNAGLTLECLDNLFQAGVQYGYLQCISSNVSLHAIQRWVCASGSSRVNWLLKHAVRQGVVQFVKTAIDLRHAWDIPTLDVGAQLDYAIDRFELMDMLMLVANGPKRHPIGIVYVDTEALAQLSQLLLQTPEAAQLSVVEVTVLVETAIKSHCKVFLLALAEHVPAAAQVGTHEVLRLMMMPLQSFDFCASKRVLKGLIVLFQRQACELSADNVAMLLLLAISQGHYMAVPQLCRLPGTQTLSGQHVSNILMKAIAQQATEHLVYLCVGKPAVCRLPIGNALSCNDVLHLLQCALQHKDAAAVEQLCMLPAVAQMSIDQVYCLLQALVCTDCVECLEEIHVLPFVQAIVLPASQLALLLHTVMHRLQAVEPPPPALGKDLCALILQLLSSASQACQSLTRVEAIHSHLDELFRLCVQNGVSSNVLQTTARRLQCHTNGLKCS